MLEKDLGREDMWTKVTLTQLKSFAFFQDLEFMVSVGCSHDGTSQDKNPTSPQPMQGKGMSSCSIGDSGCSPGDSIVKRSRCVRGQTRALVLYRRLGQSGADESQSEKARRNGESEEKETRHACACADMRSRSWEKHWHWALRLGLAIVVRWRHNGEGCAGSEAEGECDKDRGA